MTPGVQESEPYDAAMRDMRGNHVAIVRAASVGPDVPVGDTIPRGSRLDAFWENAIMGSTVVGRKGLELSRGGALVQSALLAFRPALSVDARPTAFGPVTRELACRQCVDPGLPQAEAGH